MTGARDIGVGVIGVGLMGRRHAENVARVAGQDSIEVHTSQEELDEDQLRVVNEWASILSAHLSRNVTSSGRD